MLSLQLVQFYCIHDTAVCMHVVMYACGVMYACHKLP